MENWRLIISGDNNGAMNMALDEALLIETSTKRSLPTLRLYGWNPPTLSLGFAQPVSDVLLEKLNEFGWDLVRRPTGGRAILHTDEITYSVTAPQDNQVVAGSLLESYRRISMALVSALDLLEVNALADMEYAQFGKPDRSNPVCFEVPSNYEITVQGKKLIGSAQARKSGGVLQHGSLPLKGDLSRIIQVLKYNSIKEIDTAKEKLLDHATNLESILGVEVTWLQAAKSISEAFASVLNVSLIQDNFSKNEMMVAQDLVKNKYASREWNFRI
jgi:lipoyl(octanoyl) transferase